MVSVEMVIVTGRMNVLRGPGMCGVFQYSLILHSEIDKNIEQMTNLRKDKMVVDKKLRM